MHCSPVLFEAAAIFSASLILITALAWNNVAQLWFDLYNPFKNLLASRLTYAIIVSIVAVFILVMLEPFRKIGNSRYDFWVTE